MKGGGLQEFFADYFAIDPFHFSLNLPANHVCLMPTVLDPQMSQQVVDRIVEGVTSLCLSLKRRPLVRYSRTSEIARRVAQDAAVCFVQFTRVVPICVFSSSRAISFITPCLCCSQRLMYETESGLFDFRRPDVPPLLLIVDRRDDPVTPLLNQWTYQVLELRLGIYWQTLFLTLSVLGLVLACHYIIALKIELDCAPLQAMVHELIGIQDNRVELKHQSKVPTDQQVCTALQITG